MSDQETAELVRVRADEALPELMAYYDEKHPDATPFQRGAVQFELRKCLEAVEELGLALGRPTEHFAEIPPQ